MSPVESVDVGDVVLVSTDETKGEAVVVQPTRKELAKMPMKKRTAVLSTLRKQRESTQRAQRASETAMYALAQDAEAQRIDAMCDDMSKLFLSQTERRRESEEQERQERKTALDDFAKEKVRLDAERQQFAAVMEKVRVEELAIRRVREQRERESRSAAVAAI